LKKYIKSTPIKGITPTS